MTIITDQRRDALDPPAYHPKIYSVLIKTEGPTVAHLFALIEYEARKSGGSTDKITRRYASYQLGLRYRRTDRAFKRLEELGLLERQQQIGAAWTLIPATGDRLRDILDRRALAKWGSKSDPGLDSSGKPDPNQNDDTPHQNDNTPHQNASSQNASSQNDRHIKTNTIKTTNKETHTHSARADGASSSTSSSDQAVPILTPELVKATIERHLTEHPEDRRPDVDLDRCTQEYPGKPKLRAITDPEELKRQIVTFYRCEKEHLIRHERPRRRQGTAAASQQAARTYTSEELRRWLFGDSAEA